MKIIVSFLIACFFSISLFGQQAVASSGGNVTVGGGTVSYTVGQVTYTINTGSNGYVSQGVQQPYEISVITALEETRDIVLEWLAYPNPASDFLKLSQKNP